MSNFTVKPDPKMPSMYMILRVGKGSMPTALTGLFTSPTEANRHIAKYEEQHNGRKGSGSAGN